jgi:TRAP-type mannitol/chloroaromatic compound transport system permease small subunit
MNVRESIIYSKKHKSLATGIGSVFQLVFLIPFLGWMFAPTYSVVAAYFAVEELENIEN